MTIAEMTVESQPAERAIRRPAAPVFWAAMWLALALAACKAAHIVMPADWSVAEAARVAAELAIFAHEDVLYAMGLGLIAHGVISVLRGRPRAQRFAWGFFFGVAAISVIYAVISIAVFQYQHRPLTRAMLYMAGDVKNMRSSVTPFATPGMLAAVVGLPVGYVVLAWLTTFRSGRVARAFKTLGVLAAASLVVGAGCLVYSTCRQSWLSGGLMGSAAHLKELASAAVGTGVERFSRPAQWIILIAGGLVLIGLIYSTFSGVRQKLWHPVVQWAAVLLIFCLGAIVRGEAAGPWSNRDNHRVIDNPHYALMASFLADGQLVRLGEYQPADVDDFRPVAERGPTAALPTVGLKRGPKNVILVVGESLGAQHMGIYGGRWPTTPRLAAEASNCLIGDSYYSHVTNTANSMVPLMLSRHSQPTTYLEWTVEWPDMPGTTAAQRLKERGYRTAFISGGDNQWAGQEKFLADRGFDTIWDYRQTGKELTWEFSWGCEDRLFVDMLLKWIDQDKDKPFFIFSWNQGTHHPYYAGPEHKEIDFLQGDNSHGNMSWDLNNYLNSIHEFDAQMGRLFDEIRRRGMADDTIVVIVGDHGEGFGVPHALCIGHSGRVYQEDIRVPLIIWSPALFSAPARPATIASHVDLMPTTLDLLGMDQSPSWQGRSIFSADRPPRAYAYGAMADGVFGLRDGKWKYIYNSDFGREELYDLSADPQEQINLAAANTPICQRLRQRLSAWVDYQRGAYRR